MYRKCTKCAEVVSWFCFGVMLIGLFLYGIINLVHESQDPHIDWSSWAVYCFCSWLCFMTMLFLLSEYGVDAWRKARRDRLIARLDAYTNKRPTTQRGQYKKYSLTNTLQELGSKCWSVTINLLCREEER
jgi:hypothetical protein